VRGERDPIVGAGWASSLAEALRCEVVTVPGAAHCAHFTHPQAVVAAARGFV
jgi:pimeloyl-ACP methyl ester carboxylesterase